MIFNNTLEKEHAATVVCGACGMISYGISGSNEEKEMETDLFNEK